jgi:hypothetical protein
MSRARVSSMRPACRHLMAIPELGQYHHVFGVWAATCGQTDFPPVHLLDPLRHSPMTLASSEPSSRSGPRKCLAPPAVVVAKKKMVMPADMPMDEIWMVNARKGSTAHRPPDSPWPPRATVIASRDKAQRAPSFQKKNACAFKAGRPVRVRGRRRATRRPPLPPISRHHLRQYAARSLPRPTRASKRQRARARRRLARCRAEMPAIRRASRSFASGNRLVVGK